MPNRIELAKFPGNKRFAVTTSWDDGHVFDRRIVAYFNEVGLKGTFNLNSTKLRTRDGKSGGEDYLFADEIAELYRGHEVAIHTCTHPHLPMIDLSQAALEVLEDRRNLEDLVGYPVRGMAYPFGTYSPKIVDLLRSLGIVYSRTTEQHDPCFPPKEPLAWGTTAHQYTERDGRDVGQHFLKIAENPRAHGIVYFVWGHGFEFGRPPADGSKPDRWDELPTRFGPLAGRADTWYCTNIELFDYEAARQGVVIAANKKSAYNPSAIPVTLVVDGKAVEVPAGKVVELM